MSKALVLGTVALALSAGVASAQAPAWPVYPSYGYAPYGYGYAPLYDYAAPGYGYAGYGAPATAGATVIIVRPGAPAYAAPPAVSGYYNYAPGYSGAGYAPGYWGGYGR